MTAAADGPEVYAPHGYADLFGMVVRPNAGPAPRDVYEDKAARWLGEWPQLTVLPWEQRAAGNTAGPRAADG
ncbi:nucleotidyltransferase family protein [Modestobacter muralis]|uniref:Nucleotidyltransferase family protein n=1 Tax=Modestobacter muralis TaxID=1608614 RepID=A0A6P0H9J3_9ACTN|nr:nucleotidyltransferase family protein [Modestobacter muralis]NEN50734.1 nucleotidyltransferase family protein [Modestobacter muralis]